MRNVYLSPLAIYFLRVYFFKEAFGLQHNEGEDIEVSHIPLPPHCVASPVFNIPYQSGTFIATDELHSHIIIIQSP